MIPAAAEVSMPYTITGPAIENSFTPTPRINPSVFDSMAGDDIAFANPVIGTRVPAPPCFAIFRYRSRPVSKIPINTRVTEVSEAAVSFSKFKDV